MRSIRQPGHSRNPGAHVQTGSKPVFALAVSLRFRFLQMQSTLVISKSKGPTKTLRDIRTSTYKICSIEEKNNLNNQISQMTM